MEKLGETDLKYFVKYKDTVSEIIEKARRFIDTSAWDDEDDKLEYEETVNKVSDIIK